MTGLPQNFLDINNSVNNVYDSGVAIQKLWKRLKQAFSNKLKN